MNLPKSNLVSLKEFVFLGIHFQTVPFIFMLTSLTGQVEEITVSNQDIPEEPEPIGSDVDEADRFSNLRGLSGTMGQVAPETSTDKFPEQVEPQRVIALTENRSFTRGQSPDLVVGSLFQCDDRSDPGPVQNGIPGVH